jgi:hypothetical protein
MVLKYEVFNEVKERERQKESEIKDLKEKVASIQLEQDQKFSQILTMLQKNPKLARLKPEVLMARSPTLTL